MTTDVGFRKVPDGVALSPVARAVFDVLAQHSSFPWPILQTQCKRLGLDPATLASAAMTELAPLLATAVERFTSPEHGAQVLRALRGIR